MRKLHSHISLAIVSAFLCSLAVAQQPTYPKEIRGYKVERTVVELKRDKQDNSQPFQSDPDQLVRFGEAKLVGITPFGINLEIPIVIAPVTEKGHVDFLSFEDMVVNGTPVEIEEYHHGYDLPNKNDLVLKRPLRFSVNIPNAMLAALGEWANSKETWPITGRVYVFGRYKKFLFTFKRAIPVELNLTIHNPLRK